MAARTQELEGYKRQVADDYGDFKAKSHAGKGAVGMRPMRQIGGTHS
jgi:hypothetical protein